MATISPESATRTMDDRKTSILVRFNGASAVTVEQYDETMRRLEASGEWLPNGLEYHVAFESDGNVRISEIWDSREQFDAFRKRLMPLLSDVGIVFSGEPQVLEIHNIVRR